MAAVSGEWSPEQRRRVRALLTQLTGGADLPELQREAEAWRESGDLNEGWIRGVALEAGEILHDLPADG